MPRLTYQAKPLPLQRECGSWAKEKVSTRGRKRTLTDSERKMNRSEVSFKWNKCRIYVGDQLDHWCLPRKYGRFMLLIDNNLLLPSARLHILNNIYRK
jgi:hypothetical protein